MGDFELWVYRGAIVILLIILWYLFKGILKELKAIKGFLQALQLVQTRQDEKFKAVTDRMNTQDTRLNDHAERIRKIERKQDACKNCNI